MKFKPFGIDKRVYIISSGTVVGSKEKKGPLGELFDFSGDDKFGKDSWEKAEAEMQRLSLAIALNKSGMDESKIDTMFAGDLINQCTSSSYGLANYKITYLGIFGACSTCAEGLLMSAIFASSVSDRCAAITSSHYCSAERQFRTPMEYGGQRAPTSQWTVTGAGAFIISSLHDDKASISGEFIPEIVDVMPGCITDRGIKDANNMGAAMAPAAADTLERYFKSEPSAVDYDLILTGDLGIEGSGILIDMMKSKGYDISKNHADCGKMIYEPNESDTHAGGSGCGCSAVVLSADILPNMSRGKIRDVLFVGTGALMNPMSINQKQTIPSVAHLVHIRASGKHDTDN